MSKLGVAQHPGHTHRMAQAVRRSLDLAPQSLDQRPS